MTFQYRQSLSKKAAGKYMNRIEQKMAQEANKPDQSYALNPTDEIFKSDLMKKALEVQETFEASDKNEEIIENKIKRVTKRPVTKKAIVKKATVVKKKTNVKKKTTLKKKVKS